MDGTRPGGGGKVRIKVKDIRVGPRQRRRGTTLQEVLPGPCTSRDLTHTRTLPDVRNQGA